MGWDLASSNLSEEIRNYKLAQKLGMDRAATLSMSWTLVDEVVFPDFKIDEGALDSLLSFIGSMKKLEDLGIVSFSGSNNWVVSASRSKEQEALFCQMICISVLVCRVYGYKCIRLFPVSSTSPV